MKTYENEKSNAKAAPGFWDGFASIFGKSTVNGGNTTSDSDAMRGDWEAVGHDLYVSMKKCVTQ